MDQAAIRNLISQLADDLSWLEKHGRSIPDQDAQVGAIRFAAAMVRDVVGPFLEGQQAEPLHIAVVGGAGAGKSTIANMLSGSMLAEANPQAGFTRHPIAYAAVGNQTPWSSHLNFLGPLRRLTTPAPSNLDEDVYQVRKVTVPENQFTLLSHFVVWDCPDMTTWAASNYVPRLIEVSGLADVIVYVASDERYNDAVPTQFLKMLLQAGKPVVTVVVKMREADVPAFLDHFQKSVLAQMPAKPVACLAVPQLSRAQLDDPFKLAGKYRAPLVNQVSVFASSASKTRQRSVVNALAYLKNHQNDLVSVAKGDLVVLDDWRNLVRQGEAEFVARYRREFLDAERFPRFDEALVKLLDLLEFPGMDKIVKVMRAPFGLLKKMFFKAMQRPEAPPVPEKPVLDAALKGWLDGLRKETARRAPTHPAWAYIDKGFAGGMTDQVHKQFDKSLQTFHKGMNEDVDRIARAIYEELQKNPVKLTALRSGKLIVILGVVVTLIVQPQLALLWKVILAPVLAALTDQLVDLLGAQYVEAQRAGARARQEVVVRQHLADPLAECMIQWPTSGGSALERLSLILRRIPESTKKLEPLVQEKLKEGS